jgi:hypothetical protein
MGCGCCETGRAPQLAPMETSVLARPPNSHGRDARASIDAQHSAGKLLGCVRERRLFHGRSTARRTFVVTGGF